MLQKNNFRQTRESDDETYSRRRKQPIFSSIFRALNCNIHFARNHWKGKFGCSRHRRRVNGPHSPGQGRKPFGADQANRTPIIGCTRANLQVRCHHDAQLPGHRAAFPMRGLHRDEFAPLISNLSKRQRPLKCKTKKCDRRTCRDRFVTPRHAKSPAGGPPGVMSSDNDIAWISRRRPRNAGRGRSPK